jgi:hypothetical protein
LYKNEIGQNQSLLRIHDVYTALSAEVTIHMVYLNGSGQPKTCVNTVLPEHTALVTFTPAIYLPPAEKGSCAQTVSFQETGPTGPTSPGPCLVAPVCVRGLYIRCIYIWFWPSLLIHTVKKFIHAGMPISSTCQFHKL